MWLERITEQYQGNIGIETLEIPIENTTGKYALPDNSLLRSNLVLGIFVVDNPSSDRYSPSSGRPLVTEGALRNASLTLKCNNVTILDSMPLIHVTSSLEQMKVHPLRSTAITPDQSYVQFGNASSVLTAGQSLLLHFYYKM